MGISRAWVVPLWIAVAVASCGRTTQGAGDGASAPAACGSLGGPCATEGAMCTPAPIGSSWSHALRCSGGKWGELEIAPLPQPPQAHASAAIPKLDAACNADADCLVVTEDIDGPHACCGGCTQRAVNKTWNDQFTAACAASPPKSCPPIGCAMAIVHAECKSHACTVVPTKH